VRHARACRSRDGGRCNCTPRYQAHVFDSVSGRRLRRTFGTLTAPKLWRQDAQVALRRGTMRGAPAPTLAQAAQNLIAGMRDGSVLDRGGRQYKPSTIRSYETSSRLYLAPLLELLSQCVGAGEGFEADHAAADFEECFVDVVAALVADAQAPVFGAARRGCVRRPSARGPGRSRAGCWAWRSWPGCQGRAAHGGVGGSGRRDRRAAVSVFAGVVRDDRAPPGSRRPTAVSG
jgi:hypothetical protein